MTTDELCRLQGLNPRRWQLPPAGASEKEFRECVGNAISGNIINLLLVAALSALGLVDCTD